MEKVLLAGLLGSVVACATAVPASAAPPDPVDDSFVVTKCGSDVEVRTTGKLKVIDHGASVITISPGTRASLTNATTGESVTLNISGTFHERTLANGDVVGTATGHNVFGGPSVEGILYTTGNVSYRIDGATGAFTLGANRGTIVDVCDQLA